jgi:hypothetical protein
MAAKPTEIRTALRKRLGVTEPPAKIGQDPYDGNEKQLRRLARLKDGEQPRGDDLYDYVEALRFTKIDTPLFVYMLPVFLEIWREDLLGINSSPGGTMEYFWAVLADPKVFEVHLNAALHA